MKTLFGSQKFPRFDKRAINLVLSESNLRPKLIRGPRNFPGVLE